MARPLLLVALLGACSRGSAAPTQPAGPPTTSASVQTPTPPVPDDAPATSDGGFDASAWVADDSSHRHFVLYVPTPYAVIDKMLEVARLRRDDVLYDLGCGDGRIPVKAAQEYGVKAVGIDIDPQRIAEARANVAQAGVESLVTLEQANVLEVDLSPATVIAMYLSPKLLARLAPRLARLAPGTRIVTHDYEIAGAEPDGHWTMTSAFFGRRNELWEAGLSEDDPRYPRIEHRVFLWVTPLRWTQ
jgi:precorrin-6B methylase 2